MSIFDWFKRNRRHDPAPSRRSDSALNSYANVLQAALERTMQKVKSSPPAPIVDTYMIGSDGISALVGKTVPPEKWAIWFVFRDEAALKAARDKKLMSVAREMKSSLAESGFPKEFIEQVDVYFCSQEAIDEAGGAPPFLALTQQSQAQQGAPADAGHGPGRG